MRDAFGGAFMIRLFLVFIFIYMFFTAIALNYAKAFKVKNRIIDYLEDNEIMDLNGQNASEYDKMDKFIEEELLGTLNYHVDTSTMDCKKEDDDAYIQLAYCQNGIKITQINSGNTKSDGMGVYYEVETYFTWSIPFLKKLMALSNNDPEGNTARGIWTISGETRTIINNQK